MKKLGLFVLVLAGIASHALTVELKNDKKVDFWGDEVASLENLIAANEKHLLAQKHLKDKMKLFQKQKEEFMLGNQSKSHAFSMVSNAREILTAIREEHLSYLFPTEYYKSLFFSLRLPLKMCL